MKFIQNILFNVQFDVTNTNVKTDDLRTPGPRVVKCRAPKSSGRPNVVNAILRRYLCRHAYVYASITYCTVR